MEGFIYMDHGATSWPKPQAVLDAIQQALTVYGANPGRGAYDMALNASRQIYMARQVLTEFFHGENPQRLVFTNNTTQGVNYAVQGLLEPGDHVLYSPLEHNAVWRPIMALQEKGIAVEMIVPGKGDVISADDVERQIKENTKMIVCVHASNITGAIQPIGEIGRLARQRDILFLVDAAQSAGILPLDIQEMRIDLLAAPGHKGLYGPMGTGFLYVGQRAEAIKPLMQGGTGSHSLEYQQPQAFPDRLEAGTLNAPGIAGLKAGVEWLQGKGVETVQQELQEKTQYLLKGLCSIEKVMVYGPPVGVPRTSLVTVNIDGLPSAELAFILDKEYGIGVRAGFHCTSLGHKMMGTLSEGAVRFSLGCMTSYDQLDSVVKAVAEIAGNVESV